MTCGARNEYNDVCGETYTCPSCRSGNEADRLCARIADLERVLKDTCELMDKCAGRLNVFVAQHVGSGDEYFVFELNRLSVCAGALDAMSRKALSEIKSVLGKGANP